ncbi:hypothetical protein DQ04_07591020 [Trypanosoma grayi]|uniref:hypothetical protein n=1 Tax=Trypanosoma grayi TaxID=71804 RepID=UPI0004F40B39|nr:hypothetical protein DQ04_07591020 [Trypanosoma grayi]KEG08265.1 hypothetical protein DQ04_07591020 [Trypanosoma grayi]
MFLTPKIFIFTALTALVLSFLYADLTRLPSAEEAQESIVKLLSKSEDCVLCGDVLRSLDVFQQAQSNPIMKATEGYDKPHSAFIRSCEEDPSTLGCDTALDRHRVEKAKRAALIITSVEQSSNAVVAGLLRRRYKDFMGYILAEKQQEQCATCIVEDGPSPRLVANPINEVLLGYVWYLLYPINERHRAFCWQHCEGVLTVSERLHLWMLRFYLVHGIRFRLIALQQEHGTIFVLLVQMLVLWTVLQRYVGEARGTGVGIGNGGGGGAVGGITVTSVTPNGQMDISTVAAKACARRAVLARGKSGGGRRD